MEPRDNLGREDNLDFQDHLDRADNRVHVVNLVLKGVKVHVERLDNL